MTILTQAAVNLIVIEPDGTGIGVIVNFIGNGWEGQWHRRCVSLEDGLQAIRDELAPHPNNVTALGTRRQ